MFQRIYTSINIHEFSNLLVRLTRDTKRVFFHILVMLTWLVHVLKFLSVYSRVSRNPSETDEGYYTCIAGNIMGETVSSAYLQVAIIEA